MFAANSALLHTVRNIVPLLLLGAPHEGCGVLRASRSALGESSRYSAGSQNQEGPNGAGPHHRRCSHKTARPTQQKVSIFPNRQKCRLDDILLLFFFIFYQTLTDFQRQTFSVHCFIIFCKSTHFISSSKSICLKGGTLQNVHLTLGVVTNQPEKTISAIFFLFDIIKVLFPELNNQKA